MNRREFITRAAGFAIGAKLQHDNSTKSSFEVGQKSSPKQLSFPSTVADVRLVDSKIARDATQLGREVYPPYLFNHAVRTFLFGSLIGKKLSQRFDEEVLYLACILHDLGLTDRFEGELPFEIQGAEAAKTFLEQQTYAKDKLGIVWDGNRHARFCYRTLQTGRDQISGRRSRDRHRWTRLFTDKQDRR